MLTQDDFNRIQKLMELVIEMKVKPDIDEIKDRIKYLPAKDEYLAQSVKYMECYRGLWINM